MSAPGQGQEGSLLAVIGDEASLQPEPASRLLTGACAECSRTQLAAIWCKVDLQFVAALQDTVTGFLLAGVGNVDLRRKTNFLIVTESKCDSMLTSLLKASPLLQPSALASLK